MEDARTKRELDRRSYHLCERTSYDVTAENQEHGKDVGWMFPLIGEFA
jgi:hypothetical protein